MTKPIQEQRVWQKCSNCRTQFFSIPNHKCPVCRANPERPEKVEPPPERPAA
jgi:rRNA maturation endonuclease Nob1